MSMYRPVSDQKKSNKNYKAASSDYSREEVDPFTKGNMQLSLHNYQCFPCTSTSRPGQQIDVGAEANAWQNCVRGPGFKNRVYPCSQISPGNCYVRWATYASYCQLCGWQIEGLTFQTYFILTKWTVSTGSC